MFFLQAVQAPVPVRIEDRIYYVPKMTMDELVNWGIEIVSQRVELVTADMDDDRKREHLTFYPIVAPGLQDMAMHVRTVDGIRRVVRQCFSNPNVRGFKVVKGQTDRSAQVPNPNEQEIDTWIANSGIGRLSSLAWELADLRDVSQENPSPDRGGSKDESPLTSSERGDSTSLPKTGQRSSLSGTPSIPPSTGVSSQPRASSAA